MTSISAATGNLVIVVNTVKEEVMEKQSLLAKVFGVQPLVATVRKFAVLYDGGFAPVDKIYLVSRYDFSLEALMATVFGDLQQRNPHHFRLEIQTNDSLSPEERDIVNKRIVDYVSRTKDFVVGKYIPSEKK
ncbi:MAG: hypothetical protein Q7R96_06230 [Nanoarchaeota archaeon]|nr:hypothetical protein [Nanoarchaeota archaeon]